MSTTIVAQLTGPRGVALGDQRFAVITVREDDAEEALQDAISRISRNDVSGSGDVDEIELRASLSSELKAEGLQLTELRIAGFWWLGE